MICPNCNVNLANNSKYCPRCGFLFTKEDVKKHADKKRFKLIEIYFPDRKLKFNFHNISISYLFFNFIYAFYKKMYYVGVFSMISLILFIYVVLGGPQLMFFTAYGFMFLPIVFMLIFSVGIYIYYILSFNNLYIENVKARINKIIIKNIDASYQELEQICIKDNKPNFLAVIISIIIFISILIFLVF